MISLNRSLASRCRFSWLLACSTVVLAGSSLHAVVVLQDTFGDANTATPDTTSVGNWLGAGASSGGFLTVTTVGSSNSSSANFNTAVSTNLNPFTSTIQIQVRDFSLFGTGDYVTSGRFRLGLVAPAGSFFGVDDGFALEINNNGSGFRLGTKVNLPSNDPGGAAASSTALTSPVTGFDLSVTGTSWALTLYSATGTLYDSTGVWSLGTADTWGTGTGNTGASSLLMAVQNVASGTPTSGNKSFSIGSIQVDAIAVPEPSRGLLMTVAVLALVMRRRR